MVIKVQGSAYALNSAPNFLEVFSLSRLSASEPGDGDWIRARRGHVAVHESTCFWILRAVSRVRRGEVQNLVREAPAKVSDSN